MMAFLTSISSLGWALIALAAFTVWQLPAIIRQWRTPRDKQKMHPGEQPPSSGSGWY